jgi:type I restriction enzyme R subunit
MPLSERDTRIQLIDPKLTQSGWDFERELRIGPGRVNFGGDSADSMYDPSQAIIADYLLRFRGAPLAIVEAKAESIDATDAVQQAARYADRLMLRFSIASNGHTWILTDNESGQYESLTAPPTPLELVQRMGVSIDWDHWEGAFRANFHIDQVTRKRVRPYQEMAISKTLWSFAQGKRRALLLMATGTGKTFTVFQLIWKLLNGDALKRKHVLFLTDRNSLKDQAYRAFSALDANERVTIDKSTVAEGKHSVGKVFFANYQNLDEELDGKKVYEHYDRDFFDLVIIDECHRSGFGDWFGILEHFESSLQLGLTATPRDLNELNRPMTPEEQRRDTYHYFGEPIFTYSLKRAIDDGYLVPYLLEERVTNIDEDGYIGEDGKRYETCNFERDIVIPDRTKTIAADLWNIFGKYDLRNEKTIIFCVNDTHAAQMAAELRRLSGDPNYAARVTRSERNSHQLERNFAVVGQGKPRVACTVDLLTTGFDAPDVKNVVFVRPLQSAILYKQMKGRGTRLCEDVNKRYFTIFDYSGASALEDAEFDGHPANRQKGNLPKSKPKKSKGKESGESKKPVAENVYVFMSTTNRSISFGDGSWMPFEEYAEKSKEFIQSVSCKNLSQLLALWIDKESRNELRSELGDQDIYTSAFRHYLDLPDTDDVDILAKIGFDLFQVPTRHDRVSRFWDKDQSWAESQFGIVYPNQPKSNVRLGNKDPLAQAAEAVDDPANWKIDFWRTALDHYSLFGIDDLEQARTYGAPQFVDQFGSFQTLTNRYGGSQQLRTDLEQVKAKLYVSMANK